MTTTTRTPADMMADLLSLLLDAGPLTLDAIAERLGWTRATASDLLGRLVARRQVQTTQGREAGRKVTLYSARTY
jgi:predicted ArsR family transcriptional regulator